MANNRLVRRLLHAWFLIRRPMTLGVRILVTDEEDRVLLVRHTYVDGWYLPGGGVENGESQQVAAKKELFEETGIECLDEMDLLGVYWNRNASKRDHVSLFRCNAWRVAKPFKPNREIAEIGFFSVDSLPPGTTESTIRRLGEVYSSHSASDFW